MLNNTSAKQKITRTFYNSSLEERRIRINAVDSRVVYFGCVEDAAILTDEATTTALMCIVTKSTAILLKPLINILLV